MTAPDWQSLEERPAVIVNDFPATVTLPDGELVTPARVIVTRAAVYVFTTPDAPVLAALHAAVDLRGTFDPASRPHRVELVVGTKEAGPWVVSWVGAPGCGCGHALKRLGNPFGGASRVGG